MCDTTRIELHSLAKRFQERMGIIGVIGLGYVGLPLALTAAESGHKVLGFDIDDGKIVSINSGRSYISSVSDHRIATHIENKRLSSTADFRRLVEADAVIICVPTPLTVHREPDLSFVVETAKNIAKTLRPDQIVVLESTTWPGTTMKILRPILEGGGLRSGRDFFLAFSPEREDPGNKQYDTNSIPKVVGADGPAALAIADALYRSIVRTTVLVSSSATAEAVKLTENIFRSVNIALVNELKIIYDMMGIDIWEVIEAAKTKPFGYLPFYPGPGLGGHCIPIDPFYLTWAAREFEISTQFIELAGEINTSMPSYVVDRLALALDEFTGRGLKGARILIIGVAYKKNISDTRESPSLKLIELLERRGSHVEFYDSYVPMIPPTREHAALAGRKSILLKACAIEEFDVVLISTDHDDVDYAMIGKHARLVIDTRNAFGCRGVAGGNVVKA